MQSQGATLARYLTLLLLAADLCAQSTQGLITGRVGDYEGEPVENCEVRYQSLQTSTSGTRVCDPDGFFALPLLPPGEYGIRITSTSYQPAEIQQLRLGVAGLLDLRFRLRKSADVFGQSKTTAGSSTAVATFFGPDADLSRSISLEGPRSNRGGLESTLSDVITPRLLERLPLAGRDAYAAVILQPAVTSEVATGRGLGISVNGERPSATNYLLDGFDNNQLLITGPMAIVPPEAVQEYRVSVSNFSAEYGRASGLVANAVTKSGSDRWHGLLYANSRHDKLNANDFLRNAGSVPRPHMREWQLGGSAGGYLVRSRLYTFTLLEHLRNRGRTDAATYLIPTPALLSIATPGITELLTRFAPPPMVAGPGDLYGRHVAARPESVDRTIGLQRLDWVPAGGTHRVTGRVAVSRFSRPDFRWSPYRQLTSGLDQNATSGVLAVTSAVSASTTNEARAGGSTDVIEILSRYPELPGILSADRVQFPSGGDPTYRNRGRNWEFNDNLLHVRGRHIIKAGGGVLLRGINGFLEYGRVPAFLYANAAGVARGEALLARFAVSREGYAGGALTRADYNRTYRYSQTYVYLQDSYRVHPRLVLNGGLRYDRFGAPRNTGREQDAYVELGPGSSLPEKLTAAQVIYPRGEQRAVYATDNNNIGVRAGFSYSPFTSERTLVRGAYGLFYDRPFDNLWQNVRTNNLVLGSLVPAGPVDVLGAGESLYESFPSYRLQDTFPFTVFQPGVRDAYTHSTFLGVEHELTPSWVLSVAGLGSYGRKLLTTDRVNRTFSRQGLLLPSETRLNAMLPELSYRGNQGTSNYHALALSARHRSTSADLQVAYTWGHTIDNQSELLSGEFDFRFIPGTVPGNRLRSAFTRQFDSSFDRADADYDQRHNLVFYGVWTPAGHAGRNWYSAFWQDWTLAALGSVRSGAPFTVVAPPQLDSQINGRPDLIDPGRVFLNSPAVGGVHLLNPAAFAPRPSGRSGTLGRNALRGPGLANLDASISRSFPLPFDDRAMRLTLRADFYNVLNHANLGNPDPFMTSPTFGLATYGRQERTSNGLSLPIRETARQVQLMLRLEF